MLKWPSTRSRNTVVEGLGSPCDFISSLIYFEIFPAAFIGQSYAICALTCCLLASSPLQMCKAGRKCWSCLIGGKCQSANNCNCAVSFPSYWWCSKYIDLTEAVMIWNIGPDYTSISKICSLSHEQFRHINCPWDHEAIQARHLTSHFDFQVWCKTVEDVKTVSLMRADYSVATTYLLYCQSSNNSHYLVMERGFQGLTRVSMPHLMPTWLRTQIHHILGAWR